MVHGLKCNCALKFSGCLSCAKYCNSCCCTAVLMCVVLFTNCNYTVVFHLAIGGVARLYFGSFSPLFAPIDYKLSLAHV